MKVCAFSTRLIQLNNYLPYFPPDRIGQMIATLPDDKVKEILYHAMPNSWRKKMTELGHNHLNKFTQEMSGFFETRVVSLETQTPPPAVRSLPRKKKKRNSKKW